MFLENLKESFHSSTSLERGIHSLDGLLFITLPRIGMTLPLSARSSYIPYYTDVKLYVYIFDHVLPDCAAILTDKRRRLSVELASIYRP